jgi:signal transduction histidine kinase
VPATASPELYQPELRWPSHLWRYALALAISVLVWSNTWTGQWQHHRWLFWLDLAVGTAMFVVAHFRRRWPFTVAMIGALVGAVSGLSAGPGVLAAVSMATRRNYAQLIAVGVVSVVAGMAYNDTQPFRNPSPPLISFVASIAITVAVLGWGMYIGSRRELLWNLRDQVARAEAEQELRVGNARTTERSRIAREMHDVLAHRISQVSMQAGAMAFREDLSADELRAGAALIQTQANRALDELRSVLGVLRDRDTGEALDRPQPTYADLDALIDDARQSGMHIEVQDLVGAGAEVPDAAGRTVFRIVQEGLTNARKHAPGALVRIEMSGSPDAGIDVLLRNAVGFDALPAAPGSGLGLVGLAERTALRGGRLVHRRDGSTFVLHGWIPWAP